MALVSEGTSGGGKAAPDARLDELVRRLQPSLLRFARGLVHSDSLAEEVVQETWAAVVERIGEFRGESSLKTWVFGIAAKRAYTRAKTEGRSVPFSALEPEEGSAAALFDQRGDWLDDQAPRPWPDPEDQAIAREGVRLVEEGLEKLPATQRAVVLLRDVEGLTAEEACNVLGVGETNQRVLLHRGRNALRSLLAAHWKEPKER
ncbi:MAG: sigma-70 family RNA polymerase sigma factor [Myxococcales bacterium]